MKGRRVSDVVQIQVPKETQGKRFGDETNPFTAFQEGDGLENIGSSADIHIRQSNPQSHIAAYPFLHPSPKHPRTPMILKKCRTGFKKNTSPHNYDTTASPNLPPVMGMTTFRFGCQALQLRTSVLKMTIISFRAQ